MEKFIITTGKTIDLAVEAALEQLHMDRDSVSVEVLENAKSGFLGLGGQPAKVKVTYEGPAEDNAPALSSASRPKPKQEKKPEPKPEKKPERPANKPEPKPERREPKPAQPKQVKEYAPAPEGSDEQRVERFLKGLLEHMGSDAIPHAWRDDEGVCRVDLVGESLGMLIGRRGETLDAVQYLASLVINRNRKTEGYTRVTINTEDYREKREETLIRLAKRIAQQVKATGRPKALEPMNPYERRIIHSALQKHPYVTTQSEGEEPNRRVVVSPKRRNTRQYRGA